MDNEGKGGYGKYLKIENETEGSLLAHLKEFAVSLNQEVQEGQLIALSNNTGASTGPHLHWGFYRHPRNRANGYNGFIDQTPFLNQPEMKTYTEEEMTKVREERDKNRNLAEEYRIERDGLKTEVESLRKSMERFANLLACENDAAKIEGKITEFIGIEDRIRESQKNIEGLTKKDIESMKEVDGLEKTVRDMDEEIKSRLRALQELEEANKTCQNRLKKYEDAPDETQETLSFWQRLWKWLKIS